MVWSRMLRVEHQQVEEWNLPEEGYFNSKNNHVFKVSDDADDESMMMKMIFRTAIRRCKEE